MAMVRYDYPKADAIADYICEYLDSTMDPAVSEVFQEYLASQPELAGYIKQARSGMKALKLLRDPNIEADAQL